jgi:S1-C subfamily serine protease
MKNLTLTGLGILTALFVFCFDRANAQEQPKVNVSKQHTWKQEVKSSDNNTFTIRNWNNNNQNQTYTFNYNEQRDPCKVFIGVGTSRVPEGLVVDYTVDNTPATQYGIQKGDIILTLDKVAVRSQNELENERDKHQQGEAFTLEIIRNGQKMTINARFKSCTPEEQEAAKKMQAESHSQQMIELEERLAEMTQLFENKFQNQQQRPILGIYEDETRNEDGVVIGEVIEGKGAANAGLQAGDIITAVEDQKVTGIGSLRSALSNLKAGDPVKINYIRNGHAQETDLTLSADRSNVYTNFSVKRDPCAVFIGVYTSDFGVAGKGVRVSGVIDETPAKISKVQPGDVIMAFDGTPVNTHMELQKERDKHKAGDAFQMTILRNGETIQVDAKFKSCDKQGAVEPQKEEVVELAAQERKPNNIESTLQIESLVAYPNPTAGPLNVRFEAEAVPTTVRISDVTGKTVYTNTMNNFNGTFNERINLGKEIPGTFVLSVQQGQKTLTKNIVLLPRA